MTDATDSENAPPTGWYHAHRRALRSVLWGFGGLVVAALVSAVLFTPQVALFMLERSLSSAPVILRADRLRIPDAGTLALDGVTLADEHGVWARLPTVVMRWRPRALLDGDLEIHSLSAPTLVIERLPVSPDDKDEKPIVIDWPRSPVAIRLDDLTIPRLVLKTPDAPSGAAPMIGRLVAAAQFRDGLFLARLDARRTDGVTEAVTARADVNEPARRILFDAAVTSPRGGWVSGELARAAGIPAGAVAVTLHGAGPPESWSGALDLALEGLAGGKLVFTAEELPPAERAANKAKLRKKSRKHDADEDRDLAFRGHLALAPSYVATFGLPPDLAARVDGRLSLDGRLAMRDRLLATAALTVRGERGLMLAAEGKDPWKSFALTTALAGPPLVIGDLRIGKGTASATLAFTGQRVTLSDLAARIDRLAVADVTVTGLAAALEITTAWGKDPQAGQVLVKGSGSLRAATDGGSGLDLRGPVAWTLDGRWDGPRQRLVIDSASLRQPGFSLAADGSYDLKGPGLAGKARIVADDLARLTGGQYGGALTLAVSGKGQGDSLTLDLKGSADGLSSPDAPGLAALGPLELAASLTSSPLGGRGSLRVASRAFAITADGSMDGNGRVTGDLAARPVDVAALRRVIGMPIDAGSEFTARVTGPRQSPSVRARLDLPLLGEPPFLYRDVKLDLDLRDVLGAVQGNLLVRGDGPIGHMRGVVRIESADKDHLAIRDILIDNPLATFTGGFELDRRRGTVTGELDGLSGDLRILERGLDLEAEGAVSLSLKMRVRGTAEAPRQVVMLAVKGRKMATVLADREAVTADLLDARLRVVTEGGLLDARALASARGRLKLQGYRSSGLSLDELAFSIGDHKPNPNDETSGGAADLDWTLKLAGDYFGVFALDGAGSVRLGDKDTTVSLTRLGGRLVDRPLSLDAPARYVSTPAGDRFGPLSLHYGGGRLAVDYASTPDGMQARLDADKVNVAIIPLVMGLPPFDGTLTGSGSIRLDGAPPSGQADFTLGVEEAEDLNVPAFTLALRGAIVAPPPAVPARGGLRRAQAALAAPASGVRVTLAGDIRGKGLAGGIEGDLPLSVTRRAGKPSLSLDHDGPISARVRWDGPIESLMAFLPPMDQLMEGELKADLTLRNSIDKPVLAGAATLSNGRYEQLGFGTVLDNLDMAVRLDGDDITLTSLTADDGEGGTVKAAGRFTLDQDWLPVGQIDATLKSARIVNMEGVRAEVSGTATYTRDATAATLKGDLRIDKADAGLNERLPREITTLKVREINKPGGRNDAILAPEAPKIAALSAFDLKVTAPRRLFVRGRGLDSEWGGNLTVSGPAETPELRGTVQLVRGIFSFAGKDFTLTSGTLRFDGGAKIDPAMNVKAEYASADITARLTLTGPLSKPSLSLSSTPALPQDEILARILFGTSVQQLSALEAVQLAGAISSLASGGGLDVFGKARGILGLDRLSIGSNEVQGTGTAVTGGKYLTRDIYLEVTTDTSTGESKATVRYDITRKLQIEAGVGAADKTSVGVRWKEDY